jgi:hypothetical protein
MCPRSQNRENGGKKGSNWWGFYIAKTIDMHAPVPVSVANIHELSGADDNACCNILCSHVSLKILSRTRRTASSQHAEAVAQ